MDPVAYLKSLKSDLKKGIVEDLETALEELFKRLIDTSDRKNELLQLEGTFNQIESETRKGIIDYDFRLLQLNRVRASAIQLIDDLELADLDPIANPEVKAVIEMAPSKSTSPPPAEPEPISFSDFELFLAENKAILVAFPRIYRRARSIIVRNDSNNPEIQTVYQAIEAHLYQFERFYSQITPIKKNIQRLRVNKDYEHYWLRYKHLNEVINELDIPTIEQLGEALPKLKKLHKKMSADGLI